LGTKLFVAPGGHYEVVLRNYEAKNRVKKQIQGKTKEGQKIKI
jgi:hypothetical protein